MEPGRTGPEGVGDPEWSQAVQDQRAWRGSRVPAEQEAAASTSVHQREPEAQGRVAAQSGRPEAVEAVPERASQPASQ